MASTNNGTYLLFSARTTDGNSTPVTVDYPNGRLCAKVWGIFNGASITFQTAAPNTDPAVWIDVPDSSGNAITFSAAGQGTIEYLVQNELLRAAQANSGGSTTLNVSIQPVND